MIMPIKGKLFPEHPISHYSTMNNDTGITKLIAYSWNAKKEVWSDYLQLNMNLNRTYFYFNRLYFHAKRWEHDSKGQSDQIDDFISVLMVFHCLVSKGRWMTCLRTYLQGPYAFLSFKSIRNWSEKYKQNIFPWLISSACKYTSTRI